VLHLAPEDYAIGRNGLNGKDSGTHIYGWIELLEMIRWHLEKDAWDHYPDYYKNKYITNVRLWAGAGLSPSEPTLELNIDSLFS